MPVSISVLPCTCPRPLWWLRLPAFHPIGQGNHHLPPPSPHKVPRVWWGSQPASSLAEQGGDVSLHSGWAGRGLEDIEPRREFLNLCRTSLRMSTLLSNSC